MRHLPLLAIVVLIYNGLAFGSAGSLTQVVFAIPLPSGQTWSMSTAELLVAFGLLLLYLEILKATRTSTASIVDHILSLVVFLVCLLEFVLVPQLGNTPFLFITLMTLVDVVAGFTVTISSARRDIGLGPNHLG